MRGGERVEKWEKEEMWYILVVTREDTVDFKHLILKSYTNDETGDALALLIVMFYFSTLSLHN